MLYEFIREHEAEIVRRARREFSSSLALIPTEDELRHGIPVFVQQLTEALHRMKTEGPPVGPGGKTDEASTDFGADLFRLGFCLSQVVHGYGAICQVITALAVEHGARIEADEFKLLNLLLDEATASAVTEFARRHDEESSRRETQHLGFLAHELRNTLTSIVMSTQIMRRLAGGTGGKTGDVLDRGLARMRDLIDRSLSEVRLRVEPELVRESVRLQDLVDEIASTAGPEVEARGIRLKMKVASPASFETDRQLLLSAMSNLVQNALKYTRPQTDVTLRAELRQERLIIDIEDACGGLPPGKAEELFRPYVQHAADRSGLGLGLTIARRATERLGGRLSVCDLPGKGCVFTISLPAMMQHGEPSNDESLESA